MCELICFVKLCPDQMYFTFSLTILDDVYNFFTAPFQHKLSLAKPTYFVCSKLFWEKYEETLNSCESIKSYISFDGWPQNAVTMQSLIAKHIDIDEYEPVKVLGQVDTALILYSSGTTGLPKGVRLTHLNCIMSAFPDRWVQGFSPYIKVIIGTYSHDEYDRTIGMLQHSASNAKKYVTCYDCMANFSLRLP